MMRRIYTLATLLTYRLLTSLASLSFLVGSAVYYWLFFRTRTPEAAYFTLVIGLFGAGISFLAVLSVANKANEAHSYPFIVRLESRIEYLAAVLLAGFFFAFALQLLLAAVVLIRNAPQLTVGQALDVPPVWLATDILLGVLALHASDFVANGWSRVRLFGLLAIFILIGEGFQAISGWMAERLRTLSYQPAGTPTTQTFANSLRRWADALSGTGESTLVEAAGLIFWPFRSVIEGVIAGIFSRTQALAPALMVLVATVLFLIAADIFAHKDLMLVED